MKKLSLIVLSLILLVACQEEESSPTVLAFEPSSGNIGDRITITGSNFSGEAFKNQVEFGGAEAVIESATTTELVVIVPATATNGIITVTNSETAKKTETTSSFTVTNGSWTKVLNAPFIGDRSSIATFTIGQSAYLAFGQTTPLGGSTTDAALWQYNQLSGTWTKKSHIATDFDQDQDSRGWSVKGKGYLMASWGGLNEYNPETDQWIEKASLSGASSSRVIGAFSIGDYGYALLASSALHRYDVTNNSWSTINLASMPTQLDWVATVGNKAYVSTGTGDLYEWSPTTPNTITKIEAAIPVQIVQDPQIQGGTSQFAFAGDTYNPERDFFQFDATSKRWIQKAAFIGDQRYFAVNFSIGTKFYSGLGAKASNDVLVQDIYEFSPE